MSFEYPEENSFKPKIYAFTDDSPGTKNQIRIGYTEQSMEARMSQHYPTSRPDKPYNVVFVTTAIKDNGESFKDHLVFKMLKKNGFKNTKGDWYKCSLNNLKSIINGIKKNKEIINRHLNFKLRPEQRDALETTSKFFKRNIDQKKNSSHFLWNAKMRFGKTFTAYQLIKKMNWKKILILTFKPAVESAWEEDIKFHIDFDNWQFYSKNSNIKLKKINKTFPLICFGSFQDYLGKNKQGGIKLKNEWVHSINWDCTIFDEYHYGAWREKAQDLFDNDEEKNYQNEVYKYFDEKLMPITSDHYLYLSGTPFRALSSGEFIEEEIFNWTYTDEQRAKKNWKNGKNPYESLPKMEMLTYQLPETVNNIARDTEHNEFSLNEFFKAKGDYDDAKFEYEDDVQKWVELITGKYTEKNTSLLLKKRRPPMPFSDVRFKRHLNHTVWYFNSIASCYAMKNLLEMESNKFFHDYRVIVVAGKRSGQGIKALEPLKQKMEDEHETKTITLTCGKLLQGVTVKPWTGIFMLRNCSSPETYFQSAFRVQSPWVIYDREKSKEIINKKLCYIFDFAPNRALRQIYDYSCRLKSDTDETVESKISEFLEFLPVLSYQDGGMIEVNAENILDLTITGTTSTLLARKWQHSLLVNVDDATLKKLFENEKAMKALMSIPDFRALNKDLETIINKSDKIKNVKQKDENKVKNKEKKELSKDEKEYKNKKDKIRKKLIKFATRIPIFMYLTDYREQSLSDVVKKIEPDLFKKVTQLTIDDFDLLVGLNVFNEIAMNEAILGFRSYENSSLEYTGISRQEKKLGLFRTTIEDPESIK